MKERKKLWFGLTMICIFALSFTTISQAAKKNVSLKVAKKTITVGENVRVKVKKAKKIKIKKAVFSSKSKKIKVTKKGKVTGKKAGKATVYCNVKYTKKGSKKVYKKKLKCKIQIKAKDATKETPKVTPTASSGADETTPTPTASSGADKTTPTPTASSGADETTPTSTASNSADETTPTPEVTANPENLTIAGLPSHVVVAEHASANGILTKDDGIVREGFTAMHAVKEMGLGTNLGNTMESCGTWLDSSSVTNFETGWGAPETTQEILMGLKAAGFDSIRIPVAWSNMMQDDGQYIIPDAYFDRVETIMNYAFNADMYVIINIHYDSGWWARFGSTIQSERTEAMKKYKTMWLQIANRYKEYSDRLIFESANEEVGDRLNATYDYENSGYYTKDQVYELANEINQTFVDVVRGTGGNNATRCLLIAGYNTDIDCTCNDKYVMPTDTIANRMIVSIHYYSPSTYCIAEEPDNSWGYMGSWGTENDIKEMQKQLGKMKTRFVDNGIPVIIGEYGVTDEKVDENTRVRKEGRELFFENVCAYALENSMCPMLWDCSQVYDRRTLSFTNALEKAVYEKLYDSIYEK